MELVRINHLTQEARRKISMVTGNARKIYFAAIAVTIDDQLIWNSYNFG